MATPWPSPVEPRRSRANKLSNTRLLATPWLFSNSSPACSNMRFLLVTSRSRRMFDGGRSFAMGQELDVLGVQRQPRAVVGDHGRARRVAIDDLAVEHAAGRLDAHALH